MHDQLQLINLYPQRLRPQKDPLDWGHLKLYAGLLIAVMLLQYAWQWRNLQQNYQEQEVARLNQQQLKSKLADLKSSVPAGEKQRLENRLAREKERRALLLESQQLYLHNVGAERYGFYKSMAAIANTIENSVSVERIIISGKQRQISMSGRALNASSVPEYLGRLQQQSAMNSTLFTELQLSQKSDMVNFSMGTLNSNEGRNEY
ncbi:hypothetical protein [uncultured Pseudoteredinibacter sp.]|uniref:hypothetical protein n=1 Tax=uncultured Pseudoteredinibacter sp. TaxID=1641701 RepID=UPI00261827E3|nr:hypothetical protein [uncultured Pseudoteredinibacter sp.]